MKIAYLSQTALSDVDLSYIKEAQKLMDITYYIIVTPLQRQKAALCLSDLPHDFEIIPGTRLESMKQFEEIVDLSKVYVVNYTYTNNHSLKALTQSYRVYKELISKNYDVIHLTWPPQYFDLFIYRLRKRIVLTVHDPFPHSSVIFAVREYERKRAFKAIDHFILLNVAQKEEFIHSYNITKATKHVYDSCLSIYDYLYIHKDCVKTVNKNQILFFGQIFSHKGIDYLLEAMVKVHEVIPDARLIVAGSGHYWFNVEPYKKLDYIDIQNRYIPDNELVELVSSSLFIVVPYIDATQSGVVMTSYTFNRPCIATNVGALPEMVRDRYNGRLVQPRDSYELALAIIDLLKHPDVVEQYSDQISKDYKVGNRSWKSIANQHFQIYRDIYNKNNSYNNENSL